MNNHIGQASFSIIILSIGLLIIYLFDVFKADAPKKNNELLIPQVLAHDCELFTKPVQVDSQGSIRAFRETDISSEVDGRVVTLSDSFLSGRLVKKDTILIEIDPEPYQLALNAAEAQIAQAQLNLAQEQARADQAKKDWLSVGRNLADASDLALRKPQIDLAKASIKAAQADLDLAKRRLRQCTIKAPFDGYIERTNIGVGQVVRAGSMLGHIIDSRKVEVTLPILNQDMAFLELPNEKSIPSNVVIEANVGQTQHKWKAKLTRIIPRIGARNQQFICVAEIEEPFAGSIPLLPDLFIKAQVDGIIPQSVIEIPRDCIHEGNYVWLLTDKSTLQRQDVNIIRYNKQAADIDYNGETVLINQGLHPGDRICVTRLPVMANNLNVKILEQAAPTLIE